VFGQPVQELKATEEALGELSKDLRNMGSSLGLQARLAGAWRVRDNGKTRYLSPEEARQLCDTSTARSSMAKSTVRCETPIWMRRFVAPGGEGVMLVFSRTDTTWFHDLAIRCDAILFMRGRLRFLRGDGFVGGGSGAGSMLLARGRPCVDALRRSGLGLCVNLLDGLKEASLALKLKHRETKQ
jgi:hypothetical protein